MVKTCDDPAIVSRDGVVQAVCASFDDAFAWLLNHQGQSVHHATTHEGWLIAGPEQWPDGDPHEDSNERRALNLIARSLLIGDEWHRSGGCIREGQLGRENCGTCVLLGYEPRGGYEDDYCVRRDGPNYAGWGRVYVEAKRVIPARWRKAFITTQLGSDNLAYAGALARSIATFGVKFTVADNKTTLTEALTKQMNREKRSK